MDNVPLNAQNVINMSDYQPEAGYPAISQVEAYWDALRGNRLVPTRSDVDPRGIDGALENAFVLERIAVGIARIRVAGSHLSTLMGMEVRGMPLTSFIAPTDRHRMADALEEMFQAPATISIRMTAPAGPSRAKLDARMILMPLRSDLGDISRALGCLVSKGDVGIAPRRFDISDLHATPLVQDDLPASLQTSAVSMVKPAETPGLAEPAREFRAETSKKKPPYLRLVNPED